MGKLFSGVEKLDYLLCGGFDFGQVVEWGVPFGLGGREIVLKFIASAIPHGVEKPEKVLWISSREEIKVYPPSWQARGVSLKNIFFVNSKKPLQELAPVFLESCFQVIVFDAAKIRDKDLAYLSHKARKFGFLIFILRDYFLSQNRGNVWAKKRLNCGQNFDDSFFVRPVRGYSCQPFNIKLAS